MQVSTIKNLWDLIDSRITGRGFARHFMARAFALIVVPILVYMAVFKLHFFILRNEGVDKGFMMSPEFQTTLNGSNIEDTFQDVGYFSEIYLRHEGTSGGYLHSHRSLYQTGSKQQQITCYQFHDENSLFTIVPELVYGNTTVKDPVNDVESLVQKEVNGFVPIQDGSLVRLL